MKKGYLSQYFESVAAKRLSAVEADAGTSHQHEFNGTKELKQVLGTGTREKKQFPAFFLWFGSENEGISSEGFVTWYDARISHPTRSEYRLYFSTTEVSVLAREGDMMFIAKRTDGSVMIIVTANGSTLENQLSWLFGLEQPQGPLFEFSSIEEDSDVEVDFAVRFILDELGIEAEEPEADKLDGLLVHFKGVLPTTAEFSLFARDSIKGINSLDDPDAALMAWMDQEEKLFRRMERHSVEKRIRTGFVSGDETDVDGFINFSLQVQNRRKKRAGSALENHLKAIFDDYKLRFDIGATTENKSKPDFLFPGKKEYHSSDFSSQLLTMLGAKTTCKERWRQVNSEAARIEYKHLLTLEPGISITQTNEMQSAKLQLVLPTPIHSSYLHVQQAWLMNLKQFITEVQEKQKRIG